MYQIFFAIGHFLEATFSILVVLGWIPVILISLILAFGFLFWLNTQARYNRQARERNSMI